MEHVDRPATGSESQQDATGSKANQPSTGRLSRRAMLATSAAVVTSSFAGCTSVRSALGIGQPSCSGPQRQVPTLAVGATAEQSSVTVTEYVDFACPHCATYTLETLPEIEAQFIQSGEISYVHHDYPLPVSDWSLPVANAVRSIQAQSGATAAMQVAPLLFSNGLQASGYSMRIIGEQAQEVGASAEQTRRAAERKPYCEQVRASKQRGNKRGVEGTPTIFVNDRKLEAPSTDELVSVIEKAL